MEHVASYANGQQPFAKVQPERPLSVLVSCQAAGNLAVLRGLPDQVPGCVGGVG